MSIMSYKKDNCFNNRITFRIVKLTYSISLSFSLFTCHRSGRYNTLGIPGFANYAGAPAGSNARTYQDIDATGYQTVPASLVDTGSPVKETNNFSGE